MQCSVHISLSRGPDLTQPGSCDPRAGICCVKVQEQNQLPRAHALMPLPLPVAQVGMSPEVEWGPRDNLGNQQESMNNPKLSVTDGLKMPSSKVFKPSSWGETAASSHTFLHAPHPDFITMADSSSNVTHTLVPD